MTLPLAFRPPTADKNWNGRYRVPLLGYTYHTILLCDQLISAGEEATRTIETRPRRSRKPSKASSGELPFLLSARETGDAQHILRYDPLTLHMHFGSIVATCKMAQPARVLPCYGCRKETDGQTDRRKDGKAARNIFSSVDERWPTPTSTSLHLSSYFTSQSFGCTTAAADTTDACDSAENASKIGAVIHSRG